MEKFYWLNEHSRLTLERGYLSEGETPEGRIRDIADKAQELLGIEGFSDKFYDYMSRGFYSLSSPVWSNFGKSRGFSISCFGSNIEDNVASLLDAAGEVGMMSKHGGGTSGYFGKVRPRGAAITDNGESSGAVHFMKLFEQMTDTISQGCYDDQTDILTEVGWMKFDELVRRKDEKIKVAQVNDNDTISYVLPEDYIKYKPRDSELMLFKDSKNIDLLVTKNHNMVYKYDGKRMVDGRRERYLKNEFRTSVAEVAPLHRDVKYVRSSFLEKKGYESGLTPLERLYIATQADGNIVHNCKDAIKFRFAKKRKFDRICEILNDLGVEYSESHYSHSDQTYNVYVNIGHEAPKLLNEWVDVSDKSLEWAEEFLEEVSFWDGSTKGNLPTSFYYSSIIESNVDTVQMVASVAGAKSKKSVDFRESEPSKSTIFNLYISRGNQHFGVEKLEPEYVDYDGYVYCVEVPSHRLIVRRNGHTLVCGNSTRRGRFTPYLPIDHDDIHEFLEIGTEGNPIQDMTYAVTVTDEWMDAMINGDEDKREVWAKVLTRRTQLGYPYIFFTDNANNGTVDVYKDKGLRINHSNLCSEIMLPNNEEWSFVCNLSSMNLERYDEWKDTDAVETMVYFLDAVMSEFISDLERMRDSDVLQDRESFKHMEKAYNFAKENRALGLGALGLHSYYQSKMIPFESVEADQLNAKMFATIKKRSYDASKELAELFGEPEVLKGYGRRNATLNAIAPTTSSSFILGQVSKSIEPFMSNYFVVDTAKAKKTMINEHLVELLKEKGKYTDEVMEDIRNNDGSVQHLDFLTQREKDVFKTYGEINQYNILEQAATRQHFIDQGQSLNIMVNPQQITAEQLNELHLFAWANNIKSLYYQHGTNAAQQFNLSKLCINCEA